LLFPADCTTANDTFSCSLGPNWGPSDKVEITVPVAATATAEGTLVNRAVVTDGNRTVSPEAPVDITKPPPQGVSVFAVQWVWVCWVSIVSAGQLNFW
jgi:hypothetical protein